MGGRPLNGEIGETAGKIWNLLESNGEVGISKLASEINKPNPIVYMGLGWLAREDKVEIVKSKRGTKISLR